MSDWTIGTLERGRIGNFRCVEIWKDTSPWGPREQMAPSHCHGTKNLRDLPPGISPRLTTEHRHKLTLGALGLTTNTRGSGAPTALHFT